MPCIFCIAAFTMLAGAVTTTVIDELQRRLEDVADGEVRRVVDSGSATKLELSVPVPPVAEPAGRRQRARQRSVPVAVTVYKPHKRARIQILTHDVTRAEAEAVQDAIATGVGFEILQRSDEQSEALVRRAETVARPGREATGAQRDALETER